MNRPTALLAVAAVPILTGIAAAAAAAEPDTKPLQGGVGPGRVAAIARLLPDGPFAFGPKVDDRTAWARLAATKAYADVVAKAEQLLATPLPEMTEEVYTLYKRTGERTKRYSDVRTARHSRIHAYTLAECVENKGRFVKPLEEVIAAVCSEPTWVYNFHDPDLANWRGTLVGIDLGSILPAHDMAQAEHLLGDRLSAETRQLMAREARRRVLDPYRRVVTGTDEAWRWWIISEANWNAVCHFGVVGTAMQFGRDRQERAFFVAAAEKYLQNYLRGFGPDGYCAEGMGYWGYGFGNYAHLAELLWQATDGKVNFFDTPGARLVATYPPRLEIQNGVWPAYADCTLGTRPGGHLMSFLNRHYRLGLADWNMPDLSTTGWGLPGAMMYSNPNSATLTPPPPASDAAGSRELRTFFDHGGVLTCRPAPGSDCRMAVSLKGGHNDEPHNHNDLGSYVVVLGKEPLLLDPGGEVYSARTFSKDRYQSRLLNSHGHPVPVIAGTLQRAGKDAAAKTVKTTFTDVADTYVMDLTTAYPVPELQSLRRSFAYSRQGAGSLTVRDEYTLSAPKPFGTALVTYGQWERVSDTEVVVRQNGEAVRVRIDTGGVAFDLTPGTIEERTHSGAKPTRLGIDLRTPVSHGAVTLTIIPVP